MSYTVYVWKNNAQNFHRISYTQNLKEKLVNDRKKYKHLLKGKPLEVIHVEKNIKTLAQAKKKVAFYKKNTVELVNILNKGKWKSIK